MDNPDQRAGIAKRRRDFVRDLYQLGRDLSSGNSYRVGPARKKLAQLRRSLTGLRYEPDAFNVIFEHEPPESEQRVWILIGGLFALNPQPPTAGAARRRLGSALGELGQQSSAAARLQQLVSADGNSLPYYLRQTVQLLRNHGIALDCEKLLNDLVVLQSVPPGSEEDYEIRLRWAREFHSGPRFERGTPSPESDNDDSAEQETTA